MKENKGSDIVGVSSGRDGHYVVWKIQDGVLSQRYRVKASDKAVSAILLTKSQRVITGHDSGDINVWQLSDKSHPVVDTSITNTMGAAPISSLTLADDNKHLIASSWNNQVIAVSGKKTIVSNMTGHKDWVLDACTRMVNGRLVVYSVGADQVLCKYLVQTNNKQSRGPAREEGTKYNIPLSVSGEKGEVWPRVVHPLMEKQLLIGDTRGRVHVWDETSASFVSKFMAHPGGVTCLDSHKCYLVSGGKDATVRVWRALITPSNVSLKQVGHYNCSSSIEALSVIGNSDGAGDGLTILSGDVNGSMTLLNWK
jgi:telomerase protein component 1